MGIKLCLCLAHGCRQANDNGRPQELLDRIWRKHRDDDRRVEVENLAQQLAAANLSDGFQLSIERAQGQALHLQEAATADLLAAGVSYPRAESTRLTPGQRTQRALEEIENNLQDLSQDLAALPNLASQRNAAEVLKILAGLEHRMRQEADELGSVLGRCRSDEALLLAHGELMNTSEGLLRKLNDAKRLWSELGALQYDT
ncbi:hypothetical protein H0H92_003718, partial [Tricholoma furcatifolium]